MTRLTYGTIAAAVLLLVVSRVLPGPVHHALAGVIGLLTVVLCVLAFRDARDRTLRRPALAALGLVLAQGAYGALVARGRLPAPVSAGLVVVAMLYLLALVYLAFRARVAGATAAASSASPASRGVVLAAGAVLLAQVALGAVVRHTGAGSACGEDLFLCGGRAWPVGLLEALHQAHRLLGWLLLLGIGGAHVVALRAGRRLDRPLALHLARVAPVLVAVQVGLGLWGVAAGTATGVIAAHLAVAALMLANLAALYLALGPLGASTSPVRGGMVAVQTSPATTPLASPVSSSMSDVAQPAGS
jgi:heme A synthase